MPYYVYIIANFKNTTLYIGITNDLIRRTHEHKSELAEGFTKRYHLTKLVFFESFNSSEEAIASEKKIKGWTRVKKNILISSINPTWEDLYEKILH